MEIEFSEKRYKDIEAEIKNAWAKDIDISVTAGMDLLTVIKIQQQTINNLHDIIRHLQIKKGYPKSDSEIKSRIDRDVQLVKGIYQIPQPVSDERIAEIERGLELDEIAWDFTEAIPDLLTAIKERDAEIKRLQGDYVVDRGRRQFETLIDKTHDLLE